ncbi:MAG TPA: hypothetical protein VHW60_23155 [Caulobacteraceae bacterium]|jgi:hypothetical protein|nr:hypothetical protein [Caulobacteraceae bacterium]
MGRYWLALLAALSILAATPAMAETLTNDTVIELVKAGLGPEAIVAKIKTSDVKFDMSTDQMVSLKQQGVPDAVIAAMLDASAGGAATLHVVDSTSPDPTRPHASGIYMLEPDHTPPQMEHIDATVADQTKMTGMFVSAMTYGIAPIKIKTVLPNPSARVHTTSARPEFYFYFDQASQGLSGSPIGGVWLPGAVTSPNEFSLVRFEINHGNREAVLGRVNIIGTQTGVMDKARISFSYETVATGVFKVTPSVDLAPGEYGFVYSVGGGTGGLAGGQSARIFDFSVTMP